MKFFFIFPLFFFLFNFNLQAKEVSSIYGKIRKSEKSVFGLTSPYFITFEHQGTLLAYPVDTNSKEMAEKVRSFVDKDALIEGDIKKTNFKADGRVYTVEVFVPKSIRPLELSALGKSYGPLPERSPEDLMKNKKKESSVLVYGSNNPYEDKLLPGPGPKARNAVGFRINDSVANGLIFTGAAVMLGSQLLKKK